MNIRTLIFTITNSAYTRGEFRCRRSTRDKTIFTEESANTAKLLLKRKKKEKKKKKILEQRHGVKPGEKLRES